MRQVDLMLGRFYKITSKTGKDVVVEYRSANDVDMVVKYKGLRRIVKWAGITRILELWKNKRLGGMRVWES